MRGHRKATGRACCLDASLLLRPVQSTRLSSAWQVGKSERLVLDPGDHQSPGSVVQILLRSREELFEQFF
jgi:hypothetical protein